MQVEALRLGGDQFLTKPFNPVLLAAVVKTKIERFRKRCARPGWTGSRACSTTRRPSLA